MTETQHPTRHSTRLPEYDYAQSGGYFVTICTHNRFFLFGEIVNELMRLNQFGEIVIEEWAKSASLRAYIVLDEFVVMPNHIHGIMFIDSDISLAAVGAHGNAPVLVASGLSVGAHGNAPAYRHPQSLGFLISGFKGSVTRRINEIRHIPDTPVWQRNYYEHVIRTDRDLNALREYIRYNPRRWAEDKENVNR